MVFTLIRDDQGDLLFTGANYDEVLKDINSRAGGRTAGGAGGRTCRQQKQPWAFQNKAESNTIVTKDKDMFQASLDVQQFSPEELTVKALDEFIVVEGKHEEKEDGHGYISRHFVRKYKLPEGIDSTNVQSNLSSDGLLTIFSTKKVPESNEKKILIKLTGPAKRKVTINEENKEYNQDVSKESKE